MPYTGIREIDMVLLDLYQEQVTLEDRIQKSPQDKNLIERHRRVVVLATLLLSLGQTFQEEDCEECPNMA